MNGLLLALDSAGDTLSFALHDSRELLAEHSWRAGRQATTQLAPAVARALDAAGGVQALAALAVCLGPGSYTGLRSGIGLAQGLAAGRALPLVGIDAHAILAAGAPAISTAAQSGATDARLWTVVAAGRGRYYARAFRWRQGQWQAAGDVWKLTAAELQARRAAAEAVIGDLPVEFRAAPGLAPASCLRRAGWLAELAWRQLRALSDEEARRRFAPEAIRPLYSAPDSAPETTP